MKAVLRRWWRQLTSMRTALVLLLILAVAAVPGSLLPQRSVDANAVAEYYRQNPELAPTLDRLWAFDVYSSPWFAAIYLLLMTSLVGCLAPRIRDHVRTLRSRPPDAPARLSMLPRSRVLDSSTAAGDAAKTLRRNRFRVAVREHDDGTTTVAAEKGYLREAGNLLFHFSLLGFLVGVAYGSMFGWHGNRILVEGEDHAFCNSLQQYDESGLGPQISASDLPRFCMQLDAFSADYQDNGQAVQFDADVRYGEDGAAPTEEYLLRVNHPLNLDDASVFLLGNGYAPVITYTDRYGVSQTSTAPFIPEDDMLTSYGAAIFPDANVDPETGEQDADAQVAFEGVFMPTTPDEPPYTVSTFPEADAPGLMLSAFRGDTGLNDGRPQSVYTVDPDQIASGALQPAADEAELLSVGDTWELDDGTTVTFDGYARFATLEVRHDPGEPIVLASAVSVLAGLLPALIVKRRRVWLRVGPGGVEAGGLARNDYSGFDEEFDRLTDEIAAGADSAPPTKTGDS
ncbi:MAG: cytochrome c biogenesis protein ResB [Stackebrandtia sp.]